jgi:hypothetical protein
VTIRRRGFGSGHAYYVDGMMGEPTKLAGMEGLVKAPGVTSILRMMPKDALSQWYSRTAADYAVNHWAELSELPLMGKGGRHAAIMNAPNEDRDAAAGKGTKVHGYAARLALGEPLRSLDIPDELVGHVRAYAAWLRRYQVETIAAELVVINRAVGYCGSVDLIAELRDQVWLLELKTSRSGIFRESALQATGYEHAESYVHPPEWDNEHPVKELAIDRCGSVWIRSDGVDLRALDTGPDVWAYFQRLALNYQAEDDSRTWVGELIE